MPSRKDRRKDRDANGLTPQQAAFVTEYLVDLNATQAAVRAGYSAKTARAQGSRLLMNADIAKAIETAKANRTERTGITADRVLSELERLAFSDVTHYVTDESGNLALAEGAPPDAMRAVSSLKRKVTTFDGDNSRTVVELEFKLWDKPGPLKLAGRHVGLFENTQKIEAGDSLSKLLMLGIKGAEKQPEKK